jgi:hypothetical protein
VRKVDEKIFSGGLSGNQNFLISDAPGGRLSAIG